MFASYHNHPEVANAFITAGCEINAFGTVSIPTGCWILGSFQTALFIVKSLSVSFRTTGQRYTGLVRSYQTALFIVKSLSVSFRTAGQRYTGLVRSFQTALFIVKSLSVSFRTTGQRYTGLVTGAMTRWSFFFWRLELIPQSGEW